MAVDLQGLVSQYLSPQIVGQIAAAAGIDQGVAQKLVSGAIPTVLASLASTAASGQAGAQRVADAVSNADPDLLTNLSAALKSGQSQMLGAGANMLGGLLGGSGLSGVAGALSQYSGVTPPAAQIAIGAVTHAVVGTIGQQDPSVWSDGGAIGGLLKDQAASISKALPAGLASALSSTGLLAGLGGMASAAASRVTAGASNITNTTGAAASNAAAGAANTANAARANVQAAASSTGFPMWAIVAIVVVIAVAAYFYFARQKPMDKPEEKKASMIEWVVGSQLG